MKIQVQLLLFFSVIGTFLPSYAENNVASLQLRVDPAYFSPNGDGLQDQTFIYPVLKSPADATSWTLDILSAKGHRRMLRLTGNRCPALIKWNGLDKKKLVVPDGEYIARLRVDGRHRDVVAEQEIGVDTVPPEVVLSLSTPVFNQSMLSGGALVFSPRVIDASPVDRWQLQVLDATGRTVSLFWSSGPVHDVPWDGTDRSTGVLVPQGKYSVAFQAWDKAGNESAPYFVSVRVDVSAREMLGHALNSIQVNETAMGLIVQLDANALFIRRGKQLDISERGRALLREAAILVNAYPASPVKLDGYSRAQKTSALDRDKSSVYAWRAYSYLSKEGNVKASRVKVRGRGRSPMFERRAVGVPLLANGVEVVLEGGDQSW